MAEGFYFEPVPSGHVDPLLLFWRVVRRYHIEKEADRLMLLRALVKRHKAKYVPHPEELIKSHNVIEVKKRGPKQWKSQN